jgi:hypothetical protein
VLASPGWATGETGEMRASHMSVLSSAMQNTVHDVAGPFTSPCGLPWPGLIPIWFGSRWGLQSASEFRSADRRNNTVFPVESATRAAGLMDFQTAGTPTKPTLDGGLEGAGVVSLIVQSPSRAPRSTAEMR